MKPQALGAFLALGALLHVETAAAQYVPPNGFVPNAETAVAVARAVLIPIYGANSLRKEEPFIAEERADRWIVRGTLNCEGSLTCVGGTAVVEIAKNDGRILRLIHSK